MKYRRRSSFYKKIGFTLIQIFTHNLALILPLISNNQARLCIGFQAISSSVPRLPILLTLRTQQFSNYNLPNRRCHGGKASVSLRDVMSCCGLELRSRFIEDFQVFIYLFIYFLNQLGPAIKAYFIDVFLCQVYLCCKSSWEQICSQ